MTISRKEIHSLISMALKEDIGSGDITSNATISAGHRSRAVITAKQEGIFCGGEIIRMVCREISPSLRVTVKKRDGQALRCGDPAAEIQGSTRKILAGERTLLNFIQRMSGIATRTRYFCDMLTGTTIRILDTRKTLPGFRRLDKQAVKTGGGKNHRMGLFDMVMIKDNHIQAAGGISEAVKRVRSAYGKKYKIEVEASTPEEAEEAARAGADIIMLDNMDRETTRQSVSLINKRGKIEVSGNIDEAKIREIRDLDIDYISIGALTHSVTAFDFSMKIS